MASTKIAIVGAGPVGCMLARILHVTAPSISLTIYESESSPNFRSQGGSLDLHPDTGLAAIKDGHLEEEFNKFARRDGDYYLFCNENLKTLFTFGPNKKGNERPEIDRADLRSMLAASLPEGMIKWGFHVSRLESDGQHQKLVFRDGSTAGGFDLIVGAEGAWSKVRQFITDVRPFYAGVSYQSLAIPDPKTNVPNLDKLVSGGNIFASAAHQRLSVQQMGDGSFRIGYVMVRPENWQDPDSKDWCGYDVLDLEAVRQAILGEIAHWDPRLKEAIHYARGRVEARSLYMLPADFRWEHKAGVTLIGDAAHVMTPFAGEGVNVGFDDARRLAAAIRQSLDTGSALDAAVKNAEEDMFPRMNKFQKLTETCMKLQFFSDDVQNVMPKVMLAHASMDTPSFAHPLLSVAIQGWWKAKNVKEIIFG
jgi:2-polyprenyl-6-methoxyphenol hydroxylase-like FAD-dependent oxidoreductase